MIDWQREVELREIAGIEEHAIEVLADFYEVNGQPSRAALWRNKERRENMLWSMAPDHLQLRSKQSKADPRRNAMMWLLRQLNESGVAERFTSYPALGAGFEISGQMVRHHVAKQERIIGYAAAMETAAPTMAATQRLAKAGALRGGDLYLHAVEMPPDEWPITTHEERWRHRNDPTTNATYPPSEASYVADAASRLRASRAAKRAGS